MFSLRKITASAARVGNARGCVTPESFNYVVQRNCSELSRCCVYTRASILPRVNPHNSGFKKCSSSIEDNAGVVHRVSLSRFLEKNIIA